MGYQENEEVYLTLSRKELQGLCKKHGLPTTYGKPELAKMLVTHFTKKKAASKERQKKKSLVGSSERKFKFAKQVNLEDADRACQKSVVASKIAVKERVGEKERHSCVSDQLPNFTSTGGLYMGASPVFSNSIREAEVRQRPGQCSLNPGSTKLDSESTQSLKSRNNIPGKQVGESGLASSGDIPVEVPPASFQFYVRSEEGINLFVDLKSTPSDWISSLKDKVSIYQKVQQDKSSGGVNEMHTNIDSSVESRSHLDEGNQTVSSSCMTCSYVQNCTVSGSLSCSADMEAPLQNPADASSAATKSNASVACGSSNKILSNLDVNLRTDARVTDHLILKTDNISSHDADLASPYDSLNSISEKSAFSLSRKNEDNSKPSENGVKICSGACQMPSGNGFSDMNSFLLQSHVGESADDLYEEHACCSHGNSAIDAPISSASVERVRDTQLNKRGCTRCSQPNKSFRIHNKTCDLNIPEEDFLSKRQHVDSGIFL